jgi:histidine triad (HIT) family protein
VLTVPSIFSRIIAGEIPGRFVWRDDVAVVMVDIRPIARGHCLVIPVAEVDHWLDLDAGVTAHLFEVARLVGLAQQEAFSPDRIGLMIAGFEVPHVHVHVIPMRSMADISFANAKPGDPEDLDAVADALRARLRAMGRTEVV